MSTRSIDCAHPQDKTSLSCDGTHLITARVLSQVKELEAGERGQHCKFFELIDVVFASVELHCAGHATWSPTTHTYTRTPHVPSEPETLRNAGPSSVVSPQQSMRKTRSFFKGAWGVARKRECTATTNKTSVHVCAPTRARQTPGSHKTTGPTLVAMGRSGTMGTRWDFLGGSAFAGVETSSRSGQPTR